MPTKKGPPALPKTEHNEAPRQAWHRSLRPIWRLSTQIALPAIGECECTYAAYRCRGAALENASGMAPAAMGLLPQHRRQRPAPDDLSLVYIPQFAPGRQPGRSLGPERRGWPLSAVASAPRFIGQWL